MQKKKTRKTGIQPKKKGVNQIGSQQKFKDSDIVEGSEKIIRTREGKLLHTVQAYLPESQSRAIFQSIAHMIALHDAQFQLRGTVFYSAALQKEMDKVSAKLMPAYEQLGARSVNRGVDRLSDNFSRFCDCMHQLSKQPEAILSRFEREFSDLIVSCGITIKPPRLDHENVNP